MILLRPYLIHRKITIGFYFTKFISKKRGPWPGGAKKLAEQAQTVQRILQQHSFQVSAADLS
jgi:hypothetical protein